MKKYGVMCRRSGGVTGTKYGWLKGPDGQPKEFETEEEAKAEAKRLRDERARNTTADFHYWAEAR